MRKKIAFLAIVILSLGMTASAYDASGSTPENTEPDNTAGFNYSLDASYTFSGGIPGESGPSIYFGSKAVQVSEDSNNELPDEEDSADSLRKWYIENEGSNNWGQGDIESTVVQVDGAITRTNRDNIPYLITPPNPGSDEPEYKCGDAIDDGDNDETTCPEDYGLPSDDNDLSTKDHTANSVTHTFNNEVGQYDVNDLGSISGVGDSGDNTDDFISYDVDLGGNSAFWAEEHDDDEPYTEDDGTREDITGKIEGSGSVTYEDQDWRETPDFYLDDGGTEIWMIYVEKDGTKTVGSQDTEDLTGSDYTHFTKQGTVEDDSCSAPSGWSCDMSDEPKEDCYGINKKTVDHHTLTTDTTTFTVSDAERFETSSGSQHGDPKGVEEHTPSDFSWDVTVKYNDGSTTEKVDANDCTDTTNDYQNYVGCSNESWSTPDSAQCDNTEGSQAYYEDTASDQDEDVPGLYNDGTTTETWTYDYENLEFRTAKIWDINPAENPSGRPLRPHFAMFRNTDFKTNDLASDFEVDSGDRDRINVHTTNEEAYWSWNVYPGSEDFSNDHSVSIANFKLDVDGGNQDFYTIRTMRQVFDADGPYGESDGFISIKHDIDNAGTSYESKSSSRQIVGTSSLFLQQESALSYSASNINSASFVDSSDFTTPACPGDEVKCVASVDVSLKNLNNWGSTAPNDGVQFDISQTYPTSSSLSTCKMYQQLEGGSDFSLGSTDNQQCNWEPDDDGDGSGDYTNSGGGEDPPLDCGSTPGQRWHTMEGPSVREDTFTSSDEQAVEDDYQACVEHSQCVYKGSNVSEGYVANIASDVEPGYETDSDSPDYEVCLNIHDTSTYPGVSNGYHDEGAHEFGGQWYDLDDDRVDYYLRPSNDDGTNGGEDDYDGAGHRLISDATESDREDSNNIAYYYRKNPNPEHPEWNPRGYTGSGSNKEYYYGMNIEEDCDQDLNGCDDSDVQTNFFYSFIWENQGLEVEDYDNVRSPPVS